MSPTDLLTAMPPEIDQARQMIRQSLRLHTRFVHGYSMPAHQLRWAKALEDKSIERLLIIAPPKWGKSPVVGTDYLGYRIGNDPDGYHCIYVSNTSKQANKSSIAVRDTVAYNEKYRFLYGLQPDVNKGWRGDEWFVKRKNQADKDPTVQATGVGGPILGATVQEVIFDDVADQENMATEYQREKLMDWIKMTPLSRLVPGGRAIMICTRWHENDPSAEFEKAGWAILHTPAIDEEGKSTYPQYWSLGALHKKRSDEDMGTRKFELMFQGHVLPEEGGIFKKEWWRYWRQGQAPWQKRIDSEGYSPLRTVVQSWDTAFKKDEAKKKKRDFSVCTTWAIMPNGYYLLDRWKEKVEFPALKTAAKDNWRKWNPVAVLIEDAASGQSLIQELGDKTQMPIIKVQVDTDKISRANAVTPTFEAGKVFLPEDAPWRGDFEYEHEIFPAGAHDDQVDTTTQFLNWARRHVTTGSTRPGSLGKKSQWRQE